MHQRSINDLLRPRLRCCSDPTFILISQQVHLDKHGSVKIDVATYLASVAESSALACHVILTMLTTNHPCNCMTHTHTINASCCGDCTAVCRLAPAPSPRALVQHLPCWLGI